jgi:phospholipase/lecithinase/hemolysin
LAPALSQLTLSFNQALSGVMQGLQGQLAGADIIVFDTPSVLAAVRGQIVAEGGNVVARCWAGNYLGQGASVCANPDQYFLFDSVHPTARVHAAVGTAMAAAVPEPSTWLMLVVGLVCVGLVIWRRQPRA